MVVGQALPSPSPSISSLKHSGKAVLLTLGVRVTPSFSVSATASTNHVHEDTPSTNDNDSPTKPSSSFGRLKAHRVKALDDNPVLPSTVSIEDSDDTDSRKPRSSGERKRATTTGARRPDRNGGGRGARCGGM
ncbi:DEAD-box ATP-dependent RNA helicase 50 [Sesbania bispinosa]|nr:DEAD-box ATP-dependent RNA helicase 50 [Sesbania bispinosa]